MSRLNICRLTKGFVNERAAAGIIIGVPAWSASASLVTKRSQKLVLSGCSGTI